MSAFIFPLISLLILTELFCVINLFQMFVGRGLSLLPSVIYNDAD